MMFADISSVNPAVLKDVVIIFGGLLWAAVGIKALFFPKTSRHITPDPLRVQGVQELATKRDLEKHAEWDRDEHDKLFRKIGGVERGAIERMDDHMKTLQKSAEDGREKIHKRLNRISIGLATICGRIGAQMPSEEEES